MHLHTHRRWLQENRHLRYMWIPYTDTVVVVQCNPLQAGKAAAAAAQKEAEAEPAFGHEERLQPLKGGLVDGWAGKGRRWKRTCVSSQHADCRKVCTSNPLS